MVSDLSYTSQISHFLMQDVHITSASTDQTISQMACAFFFLYTLYLWYISVNSPSSPLSPSDNTCFWPLNKLPFNFHQVTWTISNCNLQNPFQRLLSVAANVLSAIRICSFCPLGASHQFSAAFCSCCNIPQHPILMSWISTNVQKKKGVSELKMVCAAAHKTGICNWGVMENQFTLMV